MTDVQVMKAIVKLPPKNRQSIAFYNNKKVNYHSYLVSDRLYLQVPNSIVEYDILTLLQTCCPQEVHLTCQPYPELSSGYIAFPSKDQADLAFTLFNGSHFSNGIRLSLYINPLDKECEPEPEPLSDILQVQHLPMDSSNQSIYDLFRPFGPMALCKIIVEQGPTAVFNGTALIQYYRTEDADHAISVMHNKMIQEKIIAVFPFVFSKQPANQGNSNNNETNSVDYTNLYIKNLDLNAKSSDLFKHFRKYGHIISARVMKNARTNQSKGFGFVSFIKTEEAYRALNGMNGRYILSKAVLVAFHEPKKTRNDRSESNGASPTDTYTSSTNSVLSHMTSSFSPPTPQTNYQQGYYHQPQSPVSHPYQPSPQQYRPNYHSPTHQLQTPNYALNQSSVYRVSTETTLPSKHLYKKPNSLKPTTGNIKNYQSPHHTNDYIPNSTKIPSEQAKPSPPSLSTLASGVSIQSPPSDYKTTFTTNGRRTLRRRGSIESICSTMTETSNHTQRQRMKAAVLQCSEPVDHVDDIVDMLLTLKKKERSLCLFNADFIKSKVQQAKCALETFGEDDLSESDVTPRPDEVDEVEDEKPLLPSMDDIDLFLKTLEGLEDHEKKQRLGDRLFPLVKATGIKQAPKITIRLLDHIPLHTLAHLMYQESDLRTKIDQVITT